MLYISIKNLATTLGRAYYCLKIKNELIEYVPVDKRLQEKIVQYDSEDIRHDAAVNEKKAGRKTFIKRMQKMIQLPFESNTEVTKFKENIGTVLSNLLDGKDVNAPFSAKLGYGEK